jgi:hypothetical protein
MADHLRNLPSRKVSSWSLRLASSIIMWITRCFCYPWFFIIASLASGENWPDGIATDTALSSAVLTIGSERFEFSGTSRRELRISLEPGDPYLRLWYFVAMDLPGTQDRVGFGSSMFMAPPAMPVSLLDLFASAEPYSPLNQAPSVSTIYQFPHDEPGSRYVMGPLHSIGYSTAGMPLPPAVPEPSAALMLLAGLALTGTAVRLRRIRHSPA